MTYDAADAAFDQIDLNRDGIIDNAEFETWVDTTTKYGGSRLGGARYAAATYTGAGYGAGYSGLTGYETAGLYGNGGYGYGDAALYNGAVGYGAGLNVVGGAYNNSAAYYNAQSAIQAYPTDSQGLYLDSNPTIIRRPNANGVATYTQNVRVRFLQPPPVPPPGPLIIREVRPPQPPAPLPLRIRQQAPPLPIPPPLVLRERPPRPPPVIAPQTVIRRLPGLPVPPRSVIVERLPPLPPRPRDVVIERWMPYGAQARRRTLVQRAGPPQQYPRPRNVIIQYEPVQARVVRQFQRLGVVGGSPAAYVQQYGGTLLDGFSLVQQARAAGVVEDITPPIAPANAVGYNAAVYGQDLGVYGSGTTYENSGYLGYGGAYGVDGGWAGNGLGWAGNGLGWAGNGLGWAGNGLGWAGNGLGYVNGGAGYVDGVGYDYGLTGGNSLYESSGWNGSYGGYDGSY